MIVNSCFIVFNIPPTSPTGPPHSISPVSPGIVLSSHIYKLLISLRNCTHGSTYIE